MCGVCCDEPGLVISTDRRLWIVKPRPALIAERDLAA